MKTASEPATLSRSGSTSSRKGEASPARRPRPKKPAADAGEGLNPDPAVFEAAFVIDDSEDPSRAGTPKPPSEPKDANDEKPAGQPNGSGENTKEKATDDKTEDAGEVTGSASKKLDAPHVSDLTPEIKAKLRKLEKLEATYPG